MQIINRMINTIRYRSLRKQKVYINKSAVVSDTSLEGFNYVKGKTILIDCYIGTGSYIRDNCSFIKTKIGKYCSVAPHVRLVCGNHPIEKNVALHPAFYTGRNIAGLNFHHIMDFEEYNYVDDGKWYCEIGNDVWIGSDVLILGGIKVGNGAVIAAGSVVTKDVEPYAIVAGVPAKQIKSRFSERQIEFLETLKWWDKDYDWIQEHIGLFDNIDDLMEKIN